MYPNRARNKTTLPNSGVIAEQCIARRNLSFRICLMFCRQGSTGGDGLVSWEVWAALSEAIVYRTDQTFRRGDGKTSPSATPTWVWQRAEELRCAGRVRAVGPDCSDETHGAATTTGRRSHSQHRPHVNRSSSADLHVRRAQTRPNARSKADGGGNGCRIVPGEVARSTRTRHHQEGETGQRGGFVGSFSTGDLGYFSGADDGGFDSVGGGYGDRSFSAKEHLSAEAREIGVANTIERSTNKRPGQRSSGFTTRRNLTPQTNGNIGRGRRLHQSLASSRRRWFSNSSRKRLSGRKAAEKPTNNHAPGRRPVTAPAASAAARTCAKRTKPLTPPHGHSRAAQVCVEQQPYNKVLERVVTHDAGGGKRPNQWNSTTTFAPQGWGGARGEQMVAGEGGIEFDWQGEGTRLETTEPQALLCELETERFRAETASAKRKASQYQTSMREAHVSGGKSLHS